MDITPSIADDLELLVQFAFDHAKTHGNRRTSDYDIVEAAKRIEAYLATYSPQKEEYER